MTLRQKIENILLNSYMTLNISEFRQEVLDEIMNEIDKEIIKEIKDYQNEMSEYE